MNEPVDHRGFPLWDVVKLPAQPATTEIIPGTLHFYDSDAKQLIRPLSEAVKSALAQLDAAFAQAKPAEPKRPALTWNAKTAFDAFPGFSVFSDTQDAPGYTGSFPTSDTASHQVTPKFGSSDLA